MIRISFPLLLLGYAISATSASAAISPEQETLRLARQLRPIPDDQWKDIAGARVSESYAVVQGDTLYAISERLFGDPKYWPKIWALNNGNITNPHFIRPGKQVSFLPGSGTSLPSVSVADASSSGSSATGETRSDAPYAGGARSRSGKSDDWRRLGKQRWEKFNITLPPEIDPLGFDRRSKISFRHSSGIALSEIAFSEPIEALGEIVAFRDEAQNAMLEHPVFIKGSGELQVGSSYAVTTEGEATISGRHRGYVVPIIGGVRITGVRDGLFSAVVTNGRDFIPRGSRIIQQPARIEAIVPVAGPEALQATIFTSPYFSTAVSAEHKSVFIDRGSADGLQPGMVFRVYNRRDGLSGKVYTDSDFIADADIFVLHCSTNVSTGFVLSSQTTFESGAEAVLLTDVSNVMKKKVTREKSPGLEQPRDELEELDELDKSSLGTEEKKELEQLEAFPGSGSPATPPAEDGPPQVGDTFLEVPAEDAPPPEVPSTDAPVQEFESLPPEVPPPVAPDEPAVESVPPEGSSDELLPLPPPETGFENEPPPADSGAANEPPPLDAGAANEPPPAPGDDAPPVDQGIDELMNQ